MSSEGKLFYEKLSGRKLSEKETYEAKHNLVGFFDLLYQIDKRCAEEKKCNKKNDNAVCSAGST